MHSIESRGKDSRFQLAPLREMDRAGGKASTTGSMQEKDRGKLLVLLEI